MQELNTEQILKLNERMRKRAEERSGIDSDKVQETVSAYLWIARDNQLNFNELLQVLALTKESVLQSLNKVSISALPDIISDAAKV